METRTAVPGSRRIPLADAVRVGPVDPHERVEVTIVLKRGEELSRRVTEGARIPRADFAGKHGALAGDIEAVSRFAHEQGLTVTARFPERRTVRVAGPADAVKAAFGTQLSYYQAPKGRYRGRVGAVTLPVDIAARVDAVLGLDNRPVAKPHNRRKSHPDASRALRPTEIAKAYSFPATATGKGQTIAIIELGGGFRQADLHSYFASLGIPKPRVSAVGVLNGTNNPGVQMGEDGEVMLDIEVAGAVAPGAHIVVYFAPNTDQGFHDAIAQAVHDPVHKPSVISISWGGPEVSWTPQAMHAIDAALQDAAALGVTVTVAAGDDGSTDGVADRKNHVDFPASSPFALSCGGTRLELDKHGAIAREVVWNDLENGEGATGGGFSAIFPRPEYQNSSNARRSDMRGVPDVAGNADPETGYQVLVDGAPDVIGGTSAVAPLWAGLIALLNEQTGHAAGFMNPALYGGAPKGFRDIVEGNNGAFKAAEGWDATTGLGTPDAKLLIPASAPVVKT